jgi:hypothetical protein
VVQQKHTEKMQNIQAGVTSMKKSEMIESIASELCAECFLTWSEAQAVAGVVLDKIEKEGMIPPAAVIQDPGHFTGDNFEYEAHVWEEE